MPFVIVVTDSQGRSRDFSLPDGETAIGRAPTNALVLGGPGVSRLHARLAVDGTSLVLIDLGSTYGTRVNDAPTSRRQLAVGDRVSIGMHTLEVRQTRTDVFQVARLSLEAMASEQHQPQEPAYFSEDVTQDPQVKQTLKVDAEAVKLIDTGSTPRRREAAISTEKSGLMRALARIEGRGEVDETPTRDTSPDDDRSHDYRALLLMYQVSELLADASDVDTFVSQVAELLMESVEATTVVVLTRDLDRELKPQFVNHRGPLGEGHLPVSSSVIDRVLRDNETVISEDVADDERFPPSKSVVIFDIASVIATPMILRGETRGVLYVNRAKRAPFSETECSLVTALGSLLASGIERATLRQRAERERSRRKALERFHPPEVLRRLFDGDPSIGEMEQHRATVLYCHLHGFNQLVGSLEPAELSRVLHEFYETIYERVFANGGSLVKLHDNIGIALFGAPQSSDRDAVWATEAAISLCQEFRSLVVLWPKARSLALRCALDTGSVIAGFVGAAERLEYAALGEPIIRAAQLAQRTDETAVVLTEHTYRELPKRRYQVEAVDPVGSAQAFRLDNR
ncbi:MAG: GAF domain-containing protein [Deltaproteobacteria bacterium]|nr:GAF domain-containing protein [Deltaproteobacteria bacterium]